MNVGAFLCPSDSGYSADMISSWNNYCINVGMGHNIGTGHQVYGLSGGFGEATSLKDITDGLSQTVAFSEVVRGEPYPLRDPKAGVFMTFPMTAPGDFDQFAAACRTLNPSNAPLIGIVKGNVWMLKGPNATIYNHVEPINGLSCSNGEQDQLGAWTAGSRHPGGCLSLFADGHVSFLKESMAVPTWRAIGTRSGGDFVSSPE